MNRYRLHQGKLRKHPEGDWVRYDAPDTVALHGIDLVYCPECNELFELEECECAGLEAGLMYCSCCGTHILSADVRKLLAGQELLAEAESLCKEEESDG